jgi:hypothetical protein
MNCCTAHERIINPHPHTTRINKPPTPIPTTNAHHTTQGRTLGASLVLHPSPTRAHPHPPGLFEGEEEGEEGREGEGEDAMATRVFAAVIAEVRWGEMGVRR